jgi:ketosteroid isomerase-like protein
LALNSERGSGDEDYALTDRLEIDRLLRELYRARARGDLEGTCRTFSNDAKFQIAGASHASPVAITAVGINEIRSWLALMIKTFQLQDETILSMIIDGEEACMHWRARIYSRITGAMVLTDLVDLVHVQDGRIASYHEFFVPVRIG